MNKQQMAAMKATTAIMIGAIILALFSILGVLCVKNIYPTILLLLFIIAPLSSLIMVWQGLYKAYLTEDEQQPNDQEKEIEDIDRTGN